MLNDPPYAMNLVAFLVESINLGLIPKSADLAPDLTDLGQRAGAESLSISIEEEGAMARGRSERFPTGK